MARLPASRLRAPALYAVLASAGLLLAFAAHAAAAVDPDAAPGGSVAVPHFEGGDSAVVRPDGGCLRLRDGPSLTAAALDCLADGDVVTVLGASVEADGHVWELVSTGELAGWVASTFLMPADPPLASAPASLATPTAVAAPAIEVPAAPNPLPLPVPGGLTQGLAGTSDPGALVAAQAFEVESVFLFVPAAQDFLRYIPGAPERVNSLDPTALSADSIVTIRRRGSSAGQTLPAIPTPPDEALVGAPYVLRTPPANALTQGVSGTNDPATLAAAQPFEVRTVSMFYVPSQQWLVFIPGAPQSVSTLQRGLLRPESIVTIRAGAVTLPVAPASPAPTATPTPTPTPSATATPTPTPTPTPTATPTPAPTQTATPTPAPTPTATASPTPTPTATPAPTTGAIVEATISYYYCEQGTIVAGLGDGGGWCGGMANGEVVHEGASSCAAEFMGQRFRILGDPTERTYTCKDTGGGVVGQHRDVWFQNSDDGYLWWLAVGSTALIEILPE